MNFSPQSHMEAEFLTHAASCLYPPALAIIISETPYLSLTLFPTVSFTLFPSTPVFQSYDMSP